MENWLYLEINVICVVIMVFILLRLPKNNCMKRQEFLCFEAIILSNLIMTILDMLWSLIDGGILRVSQGVNAWINAWYMCQGGFTCLLWFRYVVVVLKPKAFSGRNSRLWALAPQAFLMLLSVLSIWTGWVFHIDENNHYRRGVLYAAQVVISYGYVLSALWLSLRYTRRATNAIERKQGLTLASFVILPILCGVLQLLLPGMPMIPVGVTLSLLHVYLTVLERRIFVDPLTQLNNRNRMERYLIDKIDSPSPQKSLYLMMMDLDAFKTINDRYGHLEGDSALLLAADTLRETCGLRDCLIVRYGGDEFCVIEECETEAQIKELAQALQERLKTNSANAHKPYTLSMSIGYAKYSKAIRTIPKLIAAADKALYEQKRARVRTAGE